MELTKENKEVITHIDAEEFRLSNEDILKQAFDMSSVVETSCNGLPIEYKKVLIENAMLVHGTLSQLLSNVDFTLNWKQ